MIVLVLSYSLNFKFAKDFAKDKKKFLKRKMMFFYKKQQNGQSQLIKVDKST